MLETKISKWGNSQGIRIPKSLLKEIGIENPIDQEVKLSFDKKHNSILIKKDSGKSRLMETFGYLKDEPNEHEFDWGERVGKEIID